MFRRVRVSKKWDLSKFKCLCVRSALLIYYNRDISYLVLSVQLICTRYACMCMYYLYKQLERIVNVHLCNKSWVKLLFLSNFQSDYYLTNCYIATLLYAPQRSAKTKNSKINKIKIAKYKIYSQPIFRHLVSQARVFLRFLPSLCLRESVEYLQRRCPTL